MPYGPGPTKEACPRWRGVTQAPHDPDPQLFRPFAPHGGAGRLQGWAPTEGERCLLLSREWRVGCQKKRAEQTETAAGLAPGLALALFNTAIGDGERGKHRKAGASLTRDSVSHTHKSRTLPAVRPTRGGQGAYRGGRLLRTEGERCLLLSLCSSPLCCVARRRQTFQLF